MTSSLDDLINPYRQKIEAHLEEVTSEFEGPCDQLAAAICYSLRQSGKRVRPAITLMVAEAIGGFTVFPSALALELFHTASLLADDLPCMDDADERRGHLSTHKVFNEATALLASYALIAKGYQLITDNASLLPKELASEVLPLALQNASHNTGYFGASGGQFLDLYPPKLSGEVIDEVMRKKTAALFETAFLFGWLFGGRVDQIDNVKQLGMNVGFAFQLVDDILDYKEDLAEERKINYAIFHGIPKTIKDIKELFAKCKADMKKLGLDSPPLLGIIEYISSKIPNR